MFVRDFEAVDQDARSLAADRVAVRTDGGLLESESVLVGGGRELGRVKAALGSPARPMEEQALAAKVSSLSGDRLEGVLDDPRRPARELLETV